VPVGASLLINDQRLEVHRADIGLDLDKNMYYDIILPSDLQTNRAFVIKMTLGTPKAKTDKLMDAKM